jgi:hypothetical protein
VRHSPDTQLRDAGTESIRARIGTPPRKAGTLSITSRAVWSPLSEDDTSAEHEAFFSLFPASLVTQR